MVYSPGKRPVLRITAVTAESWDWNWALGIGPQDGLPGVGALVGSALPREQARLSTEPDTVGDTSGLEQTPRWSGPSGQDRVRRDWGTREPSGPLATCSCRLLFGRGQWVGEKRGREGEGI